MAAADSRGGDHFCHALPLIAEQGRKWPKAGKSISTPCRRSRRLAATPAIVWQISSQRYAGTAVAQWARLSLADSELQQGTNRLLVDKKTARDELRKSADYLPDATARIARSDDSRAGDLRVGPTPRGAGRTATKPAKTIARSPSNGPIRLLAGAATARADDLDRADTKSFTTGSPSTSRRSHWHASPVCPARGPTSSKIRSTRRAQLARREALGPGHLYVPLRHVGDREIRRAGRGCFAGSEQRQAGGAN